MGEDQHDKCYIDGVGSATIYVVDGGLLQALIYSLIMAICKSTIPITVLYRLITDQWS